MALRASAQSSLATRSTSRSARVARVGAIRPTAVPSLRKRVVLRAAEEDPSAKLQQQLTEAGKFLQTKWEETSDAEKPAAVAIIVGAIIAQIAIGATVDAVDRLPLIHQFLEFVGLAVTVVYAYRYFTDPAERDNVKKGVESFVDAVTGK